MLAGCNKTSVKIVKTDTFCEGKYEPLRNLNSNDFVVIDKIRKNESYKATIDKFINNITINEKEFKQCQISATNQKTN